MGMESVYRVSLVLDLVDKMTNGVGNATKSTTTEFEKLNKSFGTMQSAGVAMAGAGTAITSACLGIASSTFDTQDALGEVSSLGVQDLQVLEDAAKSFSDTWAGTTKADFISASYDIKSGIASLTDEGVAKYTELAGLTAKATKSTTGDMTSLFATGYGIYKGFYSDLSDLEFGEMFSSGISTAVKNYKTSGTQMADAIKTLGASATTAQVPMEEQLAILGQLQATMSGSEAGTKYKAFINSAAAAGEKLGLSFMDNNNQLMSMPDILDTLRGKYGETIDAMEKQEIKEAFGTDEAVALIDLLYNNTGQLKTGIEDLQDSMSQGTEVTKEMAEAINNTPAQKFQQVKQQIHNVTEELGSGLLPGINSALGGISNIIQRGSDWVVANQDTVATIMRIVTVLGIFLLVAGAGAALVGTLGKMFLSAKSAIGTVKSALGLLNSSFLASPIGWVIAGIVALIAAFQLCGGDVTKLGGLFQGAFESISGVVSSVIQTIVAKLPELLQFGVNLILYIVQGIAAGLPNLIMAGVTAIQGLVQGITGMLPAILQAGVALVTMLLQSIVSALPSLLSAGMALVQTLVSGIAQLLPTLLSAGLTLLVTLLQGIVQNLPTLITAGIQLIQMLLQGILTAIPQLLSAAIQMIPMIGSAIASAAPSLISGGINIIGAILNGIITAIPAILGMIPSLFGQIIDSVTSIDWLGVGGNLIAGIKEGFVEGFKGLVESAKGLWDSFTGWLTGGGDSDEVAESVETMSASTAAPTVSAQPSVTYDTASMQEQGTAAIDALTTGIDLGTADAQAQVSQSATDIMSSLQLDIPEAETYGTDFMESMTTGLGTGAGDASEAAAQAGQDIMAAFSMDPSGASTASADLMGSVTDNITAGTADATAAAAQAGQDIMSAFSVDSSGASTASADLMAGVMDNIAAGTVDAETVAAQSAQNITSAFGSADASALGMTVQTAGNDVTGSMDAMQASVDSGVSDMVATTQSGGEQIVSAWTSAMSSARNAVSAGMDSIQSAAVSKAQSIANAIRTAFSNIRVTVPAPSLPHVSVSYSTVGSGKATAQVPNFSVSYHAAGGIMTAATMLGIDGSGTAHVGGEAGDEAILPLDPFWRRLQTYTEQASAKTAKEKEKTSKGNDDKKQTKQGGGIVIQRLYISPRMEDMDSLKKLEKLIDEINGNVPAPA